MSSAPPWKGLATQFIADGGNGPDGRFPVLAFTTEAERDQAADLLDTITKGGKVYTREAHRMVGESGVEFAIEADRLRTRLAEAEREVDKMRRWLDAFCSGRTHGDCDRGDCEACMADTIRQALLTNGEASQGRAHRELALEDLTEEVLDRMPLPTRTAKVAKMLRGNDDDE